MDYSNGNPVVVYTCDNCGYTTFGEAYITDNKTTITFVNGITTSSTSTVFEPTGAGKKDNGRTTFTRR
jgi:hypothetical protein